MKSVNEKEKNIDKPVEKKDTEIIQLQVDKILNFQIKAIPKKKMDEKAFKNQIINFNNVLSEKIKYLNKEILKLQKEKNEIKLMREYVKKHQSSFDKFLKEKKQNKKEREMEEDEKDKDKKNISIKDKKEDKEEEDQKDGNKIEIKGKSEKIESIQEEKKKPRRKDEQRNKE